jgi:hypothetical protein
VDLDEIFHGPDDVEYGIGSIILNLVYLTIPKGGLLKFRRGANFELIGGFYEVSCGGDAIQDHL